MTDWFWTMPWTQKWGQATLILPWGDPQFLFLSKPSRMTHVLTVSWKVPFVGIFVNQVLPGDHWIHATASPFFGRAPWWYWVSFGSKMKMSKKFSMISILTVWCQSRAVAQEELNAADAEKITGIAILSFIRWHPPYYHFHPPGHRIKHEFSNFHYHI